MHEVSTICLSAGSAGQDRTAWLTLGPETWLVLADGAGGVPGGEDAAEGFVEALLGRAGETDITGLMHAVDLALRRNPRTGLTTGVVAVVSHSMVWGASVGDSGAWLIQDTGCVDLTSHQSYKPLLGSGRATIAAFGPEHLDGTLLLASDGLLNYVTADSITTTVRSLPIGQAAESLIEQARLPNDDLQDDVSVLLCRSSSDSPNRSAAFPG